MSDYSQDPQGPISLELLKKAVDASSEGIVISEQEGDDNILIYVNRAFERLTGYCADEILYQDCRFLQAGDRDQTGLAEIREAIEKGQSARVTVRNYRKDGSMFWNELSISPVYSAAEQLTYFIGVQKDVTELVELRETCARLQLQLQQQALAKGAD
ncbi:PAS domain-containing protein [Oceanobacter mangrovi]|uniref:PAS domain-containing protein n=1 Tax=Oceanobacter mangrovi TaxID=2862510 RepID=UPI001C8D8468|nr:PAS domain-containing protein [Oceanobacter mangrovi]